MIIPPILRTNRDKQKECNLCPQIVNKYKKNTNKNIEREISAYRHVFFSFTASILNAKGLFHVTWKVLTFYQQFHTQLFNFNNFFS